MRVRRVEKQMTLILKMILLVGGTLMVLTWSGLRVWSANFWAHHQELHSAIEQSHQDHLRSILEKMPAHTLTFLGARLLEGGDYELAKTALEIATKKDRYYRDAFRYYSLVLRMVGEDEKAELALRRSAVLDPRITQ
jgi:tetratricopeptide (TPR) repeat protein